MKHLILLKLSFFMFSFKLSAQTEPLVTLGKKLIIILASDNEKVFGTSYFGIFNSDTKSQVLQFPVFLPENVSSFEPREGLMKEDFFFGENEQLFAKKEFQPGLSLVGLDFKIDYPYKKRGPLKFKLPYDLEELSLAVLRKSGLLLAANEFFEGVPDMLSQDEYSGILKKNLTSGFSFEVTLLGLPDSHFSSFLIALICGICLFLILCFYVLSSLVRP